MSEELRQSYKQTFASDDGKVVLKHLQSITTDLALGANSPDDYLRHLEGQRYIVRLMLNYLKEKPSE
ncbi:MAG: hypothetical protein AAF442_00055 [Pseudomonadota bacterium]